MAPSQSLEQQHIVLPAPPEIKSSYIGCVRTGNLVILSGHGPAVGGTPYYVGRIGAELSEQEGYESARICGINLLARLQCCLGNLDRVKRIISIRGYVNSAPDFFGQSRVIDGASDLMLQIFGKEAGGHCRTALGVGNLPGNIATEVEMIVEVTE